MRHHNTCKAANGRPPPESCTSSPQSRQQQRQAQQQELPSVPRRVNGYQKQPTGENHANGQHREGQSRDANPPILEETLRRLIAGRMQQPPTTTHSNDSRQHQLPSPSTPLRRPLTLAHDLLPSDSISPKRPEPGCADDAPEVSQSCLWGGGSLLLLHGIDFCAWGSGRANHLRDITCIIESWVTIERYGFMVECSKRSALQMRGVCNEGTSLTTDSSMTIDDYYLYKLYLKSKKLTKSNLGSHLRHNETLARLSSRGGQLMWQMNLEFAQCTLVHHI